VILLCGIPSEAPVAIARRAAEAAGLEHLVLNQRQVDEWGLELACVEGRVEGRLHGPGGELDLQAVAGVYVRLVEPHTLPDLGRPPDPAKLAAAEGLHQGLVSWLEVAECRVANPLGASSSNVSKPYQAQLIEAAGLAVPPTIVSNDPEAIRRFAAEHREVVYKSTSSARSIVRRLVPARLGDLALVRHLPTQFQAYVPGVDVRVHVVGEALFATEIRSSGTDYRYAARDDHEVGMAPCTLPTEVSDRCLALSAALGLPFCGIDLRRTPEGEWFCFEANPSPAYSYFEQQTGQPIGRALVEYLAGERDTGSHDGAGDRELGGPLGRRA
jgi:hypothetical protein